MTDTRNYAFYSLDLNGNGIVEGNGFNLPVEGNYPLQVGDTVKIYTRTLTYVGTDGAGGGIFEDPTDGGQVYGSDTVQLNTGDEIPDPVEEELPLNGGDPDPELPNVPVISIGPPEVEQLEGNEGATEYTFTVTRAGDELGGTSTVDVALVPGDTDADDFGGTLPETQTVTFAPDDTEKTVVITVTGDVDPEFDEAFEVSLEFATDATIDATASSAVGTITNDDMPPPATSVISISPAEVEQLEGNEGQTLYHFTLTRTGEDLSMKSFVDVAFAFETTSPDDFADGLPITQTVEFAANETERTVMYAVTGDTDAEADETFVLNLRNPLGATVDASADTATGTILNDDGDPPTDDGTITGTEGDDSITPTGVSDGVTGGMPSAADDTISALAGNDTVDGGGGDDTIDGGIGDDALVGGLGNDRLLGNDGADEIDGGNGFDLLLGGEGNDFIEGGNDGDVLVGGDGTDILDGDAGNDALFGGSGWDILFGGDDNDYLNGGDDTDFLFGGNGDDVIEGGAGNDLLVGDDGVDVLDGGDGDDRLEAGNDNDNDILTGGAGSDTFVFSGENGVDAITDFTDGEDIIDLSQNQVDDVSDLEIVQAGNNVVIGNPFGFNNAIIVQNADVEDFTNDDFFFG